MTVPNEISEVMDPTTNPYTTIRVKHKFRADGTECTPAHKAAACAVTRRTDSWMWKCFRCGEAGVIPDNDMSPTDTCRKVKHAQAKRQQISNTVSLPMDFFRMTPEDYHIMNTDIPLRAVGTLMKWNVHQNALRDYSIGYSPFYKRVIVPLTSHPKLTPNEPAGSLQGWVGKDITCKTKAEREEHKVHKYLIRRKRSAELLYFYAQAPEPRDFQPIVLVEDFVSALRVSYARNCDCIALLGTNINPDLVAKLHDQKILLWLDGDMFGKMFRTTRKFTKLGFNMTFVHSNKDPKAYNDIAIQEIINNRLAGGPYRYEEAT